jgi:predicted transcriptional regulator
MASITIKLDEAEKQRLAEIAKEQDLSMSQVIRRLIKEYITNFN